MGAGTVTIGLMSGTSLDGMDGVMLRWGSPGAPLQRLAAASQSFDPTLRADLLALNQSGPDELHRAALVANRMSRVAAHVVADLVSQASLAKEDVAAIGLHGQTVRHQPGAFDGVGYTIQLHNASLLAELTSMDVVCDFRSRDVAAGGQGAPLVPAFHAGVFAERGVNLAVLNLGGIANLTLLPAQGEVRGFDCGPANVLMDLWAAQHLGQPIDDGGCWAAEGSVITPLLKRLQQEPFFDQSPPKSTGRDLFSAAWLNAALQSISGLSPNELPPQDVQSTLCELSAWAVEHHLQREMPGLQRLLVCGGGALNKELMRRLQHRLAPASVTSTAAAGMDVMEVEAAAFAWLAWQFLLRQPGNLENVTGARGPRVLGALYPGRV